MDLVSINPATLETLKTFEPLSHKALLDCIEQAAARFVLYRTTPMSQRRQWLMAIAHHLEDQTQARRYGELMSLEMGKPIQEAIAEVKKSAWVCRYYAEQGEAMLAPEPATSDGTRAWVEFQPLGVILAVMPWNFPFWQVFRAAAPALMAGNCLLLKHASNVPQCALALEQIFTEAGFPAGVFQTLLVGSDQVPTILQHPGVQGVTLTGSGAAGASVAAQAGAAIKKSVLELGGSDPFIVLASADLQTAVTAGVKARLLNSGQSCIAAKRFIVQAAIADAFLESFVAAFNALRMGDPLQPETDIGPLATPEILATLKDQVARAIAAGATVLVGGNPEPQPQGNFYPPTILVDLPVDHPLAQEEFFGPVALVFRVPDITAAIQLANATPFGLGASAWTQAPGERDRLIAELEAGAVFINGMVKSDPRLPFGGIKQSGYGRELAQPGIREFVNQKTIWVQEL
jgi:succinate-semialdehyde dehydrogenase/glutarate-semialdehyde dehydrogenase